MALGASTPDILYEDNHLVAVNKPAGVLVQGDATGDTPLLDLVKNYIRIKFNKPGEAFLGTVHRLDRPVSGVVVFARTSKALERMNAQFRDRETKKTYWAVVHGKPKANSGTLVHWLRKSEATNHVRFFDRETPGALRSELSYEVKQSFQAHTWLEVKPITGRSHQIRVQLAAMGCPIVGDLKYGSPTGLGHCIGLHGRMLEFMHPVKKNATLITAPLPNHNIWADVRPFQ